MTNEEKAKAYDEALNWMRELYPGLHGATKEDAEHYFPELRESEDERIRRKMIEHFKSKTKETWCNMPVKDILAWLEKQKEQKPIISDEAIRDGVVHFGITQYQIDNWLKKHINIVEQKPADDKAFEEWIDDWWKHNKVNNPDSYNKGDEIQFDERGFKNFCRGIRNMYAEQKPTPISCGHENGAEWSEKDKTIIEGACNALEVYGHTKLASKLKSLRLCPSWKPSEEQEEPEYYQHFDPDC